MKKGDILEALVSEVDFPNKGYVYAEDYRICVKGVIPGQTVRLMISKMRHGKPEGRLLEVTSPSPLETLPYCPHFGKCGGCTYQPVSYEEQLKIKEEQIKKIFSSVASDYEFNHIVGSPISEKYRNKMEFSFGDEYKEGPLALGLHKKASNYDIVSITDCHLVNDDFNRIVKATLDYFSESQIPFYHRMTFEGVLRHLLIRRAIKTGDILIDLVTTTQRELDLEGWVNVLRNLKLEGTIAGILNTKNDSVADVIQNDSTDILYGKDFIMEELLGLRFRITPFSFFQTNSLGAELLYTVARNYIGSTKDKVVYDLYSGTGTIAQMLAPVSKKVIGVEIVPEAVKAAKANALLNGLDNCEFIAGDVLRVLDTIEDKPDLIILDPPRDGVHPKALEKIIAYGVENIIYISCKPTSLARDIAVLESNGYKLKSLTPVDMFPGTYHVESVVLMSRAGL